MIRPSALPLFAKCPSSAQSAEWPIDEPNDAADFGTEAHKAIADLLTNGTPIPQHVVDELPNINEMVLAAFGGRAPRGLK